jgi:peptidoglycan/xylan/chitin deacetylase (PgdA/CDA1 family)
MREALSLAVRWSGVALLVRKTIARWKISVLVYHDPEPSLLERHLAYLAARYDFVALSDVVDAIRMRDRRAIPANAVVLTFDDGYRGNLELAPLFERYGVRPTIYVCTQIVDTGRRFWFDAIPNPEAFKALNDRDRLAALARMTGFSPTREYAEDGRQALNRDEIRVLARHAEIGSHTRFHPILPTCSDEDAETEVRLSKAELETLVGGECKHFSYPDGSYREREIRLAKAAGYASARTTDFGWNDASSDPFRLKVLGVRDDASVNRLAGDLAGVTSALADARRRIAAEILRRRTSCSGA